MLTPISKKHLEDKFGKAIRYPSHFNELALVISANTKESISANTLKRLFGFINEQREPRMVTLDLIAQYLGFNNWDDYLIDICRLARLEYPDKEMIDVGSLDILSYLEIHYAPNGRVLMRFLGDFRFEITEAINSTLLVADVVEVYNLFRFYPLIVPHVVRCGNHLGPFFVGKVSGITYMKVLE